MIRKLLRKREILLRRTKEERKAELYLNVILIIIILVTIILFAYGTQN